MATVKKTRPQAKKVVPAKQANKKPVSAKPISKSTVPAKKSSSIKARIVEKPKSSTIAKKTAAPKQDLKSVKPKNQKEAITKKSSKKDTPKVEIVPIVASAKKGKSIDKIVIKPSKDASSNTAATKVSSKVSPSTKAIAKASPSTKAIAKASPSSKAIAKASPSSKSNSAPVKSDVSTSKTGKPPVDKKDDTLDPLHVKAAKAMKELSETMDLSKVRPRIQAGSPPPPVPKIVHRKPAPPLKLIEPTNTTKTKYQIEFDFRASPRILYNYLFDSGGLAGWFADEVKSKDNVFTFIWEGGESYAKLIASKDQQLVRFQWLEETDGTYFQFEIKEDDLTGDVALVITDFANQGEKDSNVRLWESQVQMLRLLLGSF